MWQSKGEDSQKKKEKQNNKYDDSLCVDQLASIKVYTRSELLLTSLLQKQTMLYTPLTVTVHVSTSDTPKLLCL